MSNLVYIDTTKSGGNKQTILGPCPLCAGKGINSNLVLISYKNKETGEPIEFAACELGKEKCGYTINTCNGKIIPSGICPKCQSTTKGIVKKDGSHRQLCDQCETWNLADEDFNIIIPPKCPKCGEHEWVHRSKKEKPNEFYWTCPNKECGVYAKSDIWCSIHTDDDEPKKKKAKK